MDALIAQTSSGGDAGIGIFFLTLWLAGMVFWVWGLVRLFGGNHTALGWFGVFIGVLAYAGFFLPPRPGSSRYFKLDKTKQAQADARYPLHAKAIRDLMAEHPTSTPTPPAATSPETAI